MQYIWENQFLNRAFGNTNFWQGAESFAHTVLKVDLTALSLITAGVLPTLVGIGSGMIAENSWKLAIYTQSASTGQSVQQVEQGAASAKEIFDNVGDSVDVFDSFF